MKIYLLLEEMFPCFQQDFIIAFDSKIVKTISQCEKMP